MKINVSKRDVVAVKKAIETLEILEGPMGIKNMQDALNDLQPLFTKILKRAKDQFGE